MRTGSRNEDDWDEDEGRQSRTGPSVELIVGLSVGGGLLLIGLIVFLVLFLTPSGSASPEPLAWGVPAPEQVLPPAFQQPAPAFPQPAQVIPQPAQVLPQPFPQVPAQFPGVAPPNPGPPPDADPITRAIFGLKSDSVFSQSDAARVLEKMPIDAKRRDEVIQALKQVIETRRPLIPRHDAVRTLGTWGTPADLPYVIGLLDDNDRGVQETAIEVLGKFKDARAVDVLITKMESGFERERVSQALKDIGPGAEKAVLRLLDFHEDGVRINACKILKVIGTKASHPVLLHVTRTESGQLADAAREALPAQLRPKVWGARLTLRINVHVVNPQAWPELEKKIKALANDPNPRCKVNTSGDYKWVELTPVDSDAETFARRVTFARIVAVHNDQRLIYLDPGR
jgi:HEAT repeat protein